MSTGKGGKRRKDRGRRIDLQKKQSRRANEWLAWVRTHPQHMSKDELRQHGEDAVRQWMAAKARPD